MSLAAPLDPMCHAGLGLMPAATQSRTVTFRRTSHLPCRTGGAHWRGAMFWRAIGTLPARVGNAGDNPVGLPYMAK